MLTRLLKAQMSYIQTFWVSMGEEFKFEEHVKLKPYQVNMDLVKKAENENLIYLHCLHTA